MSLPSASDVHVNRALVQFSLAWMQKNPAMCDRLFPLVKVEKQSDVYFELNQYDFSRIEMQRRAAGTPAALAGYRVDSSASYFCDTFALTKAIPREVERNSDSPLRPRQNAVSYLSQQAKLKREKTFATDFWTTSVWGTDVTGSTVGLWSDDASDPVGQIETYKNTVLAATGYEPNVLAMNNAVWAKLKNHPMVVDRFKHTGRESITTAMVAALLELDEIVVGKLSETTSKEGNSTQTMAAIAGNHALLMYRDPNPGIETVTAGVTFAWDGDGTTGVGEGGTRFYERFDMKTRTTEIEIEQSYDQKKVAGALGVFFNTII